MAKPEEFKFTIDKDGKILLDFRGMEEASYRRILELLQETVGPAEALEAQADEAEPPGVYERKRTHTDETETLKNRQT
jgi:hypothetical protein